MRQHTLTTPSGTIELRQREGQGTPVLYLPGHTETFNSAKLKLVEDICVRHNRPCVIPAYYGWEGSKHAAVPECGKGYIRHWLSQYLDIADQLPQPHVLVGFSMGAILMLQLSRRRPDKVAGMIGISAGFGINGQKLATEIYGNADFVGLKGHMPLSYESSGTEMTFASDSFPLTCPVRLQYGLQDDIVSYRNGYNIAVACASDDVEIWLNKTGTHALNDERSMQWLEAALTKLS